MQRWKTGHRRCVGWNKGRFPNLRKEYPESALGSSIHMTDTTPRGVEELSRFFTLSCSMLCVAGFDGRFKRLNPAWVAVLGYPMDELLSRPWLDFVHPEDQEATIAQGQELFSGAVEAVEFENRYICKDGSVRWLSWNAVSIPDEQLIYAVAQDVTARKRAEEERRMTEERARTLLEAAPDAMLAVNGAGEIAFANAQVTAVFGYEADELLGKSVEMLLPEHVRELHRGHRRDFMVEPRRRDIGVGTRLMGLHRDGHELPLEVSLSPSGNGNQPLVIAAVRDVSARIRLEDQLRQAQKLEAVGQLTSGIAHDFNNLLTVIMSHTSLALDTLAPDASERGDLYETLNAAGRGADMIKKLLSFGRRDRLMLRPVDLARLAREAATIMDRMLPDHIEVAIKADDNLPSVRADPVAFEQMLFNLATNARDAMPSGGRLRFEVRRTGVDEGYHTAHPWVRPGEYVCVSASDTGSGMDEETAQRIFEPFFTTKGPGDGTGLGLPMIYGLMKEHGGFVHVYSEPGQGTTMKLYFPATPDPAQDVEVLETRTTARGGSETILVVDDEAAIRRATKRALERHGYRVLLAADGEEALELIRERGSEIELVLTDVVMPKLGGRQLHEALKQEGRDVRMLFTSGYAAEDIQQDGTFDPGVVLPKPWTLADLLATVRATLDKRRGP